MHCGCDLLHRVCCNHLTRHHDALCVMQITGPKTKTPSHTKIALYHYLTKSEADYKQKMQRGSGAGNFKSMGFYKAVNDMATYKCMRGVELGLKCCPSVREALGPAGVATIQASISDFQVDLPQ